MPVEPVTEACTEKCNQNAAPATSAQQASKNCDEEKKAIKDGMYDQHHSRLDFGRFWLLLPVVPREEILLGFVVATKMKGPFYSEDAAKIPTSSSEKGTSKSVDLASPTSSTIASALGHVEPGTTIALHSVSVRKSHQQQGLGTILLGDFKARMSTGGCADMISVAVPKSLSKFFNQFMFYDTCGRYSKDDRRIMNAPLLEKRQKGEFTLKDEF